MLHKALDAFGLHEAHRRPGPIAEASSLTTPRHATPPYRASKMSLAPPPPSSPRLRAFRRDGTFSSAGRSPSITGCLSPRSALRSCGRAGRAYCLFSGGGNRKKQVRAAQHAPLD